ncbi:hypothetical protein ACVIIV_005321 [Bradyrhizobium sp. USDA 4354]
MSDWNEDEYYDVSFAVSKSRRYHAKMFEFYDWAHNLARVATALTGTASFFVLLATDVGGVRTAKYLTAIVAIAATMDSIFRYQKKARRHEKLTRKFTELAQRIATWEATPTNLKKAKTDRLKIEATERPVRRLIDLQAQNEEARARGVPDSHLVPLSRSQRMFGYVFTFGMRRLERWHASMAEADTPVAPLAPPQEAPHPPGGTIGNS